jgi:hypothetical protein
MYSANNSSSYQFVTFNSFTVAGSLVSGPSAYQSYTFNLGTASGMDTLTFHGRNDPSYNILNHVAVTAVPEPASMAMMALGLAGLALIRRRKQA